MTVLFFRLPARPLSGHMRRSTLVLFTLALCLAGARPAGAQISGWANKQYKAELMADGTTLHLTGQVEVEGDKGTPNEGQKLAADDVVWNTQTGEFVAVGNVLLANPTSRLSAERIVFNTKTKRGTFYNASGISQLGTRGQQDITMFGSLEPDVYFYGEVIEKIGDDKYKITRGGFTTCVQPTPRWEVVSSTSTINLHDYAILNNAVMHVKDVPVFYLPWMYFPIQDDNRATGFLMPTYGNSTIQGQSLSNAFFWAIDRSQDLTLMHDWYFSRGQGYGSEYRYVASPSSNGEVRFYRLATEQSVVNGTTNPAREAYEIRGSLAQQLPYGLRARGSVNYFSDIQTQQLYNQNLYNATLSQRSITGSVTGAWAGVNLTGNFQRSENFFNSTSSIVNGYTPSLQASLSSRKIGNLPIYYSLNSEVAHVVYATRNADNNGLIVENDQSLGRVDITPSIRAPLTNLPFFSLTASMLYRYTYFSESLLPGTQTQVDESLVRRYAQMKAEILGPVFSRVFAPGTGGTRVKHIIEPNFTITRTTGIDNQSQVPTLGNPFDQLVGDNTTFSYGVTNRLMVRGGGSRGGATETMAPSSDQAQAPTAPAAPATGAAGSPREALTVGLVQSYYTDPRASQFDQAYQTSFGFRAASNFSPIAMTVRAAPTPLTSANVRMEYDYQASRVAGVSAQGGLNAPNSQFAVGWSWRRLTETVLDHTLNGSTTIKRANGRVGGTYSMDWDIERNTILQQRWIGFYSAQCCGFTIEYQTINYPTGLGFLVPQNRRFNFGFTLAGIGTFSNFMGAFGGNTGTLR